MEDVLVHIGTLFAHNTLGSFYSQFASADSKHFFEVLSISSFAISAWQLA